MSNCDTFWEPLLNNEEFVGVSTDKLEELEKHFGRTLPKLFKDVYKISNGGIARVSEVDVAEYQDEPDYAPFWVHAFLKVDEIIDYNNDSDTIPEHTIVVAQEMSSWIGFDYKENSENPSIVYFDHFTDKIYNLGKNFEIFFAE